MEDLGLKILLNGVTSQLRVLILGIVIVTQSIMKLAQQG